MACSDGSATEVVPVRAGTVLVAIDAMGRAADAERRLVHEADQRAAADRANDAKTELLRRMSHDLRTPLNSILGHAQLLEGAELADPADQRSVEQILEAGGRLLALVDEVVELARLADAARQAGTDPSEAIGLDLHADACRHVRYGRAGQVRLRVP